MIHSTSCYVYNLALNPSLLNVIGSSVLKILGRLVAPDLLTPKDLYKDVVDEGQHVLGLHAPSLELERPSGTRPVESRPAVSGEEGEVFPDMRVCRWGGMTGIAVQDPSSASACQCPRRSRAHTHA